MPGIFRIGTSNVVVPEPTKAQFPPEFQAGTRLTYYASLYNSVEINSTFYRLPLSRTLEKWAGEVPDDFRFTLKLWREVTHSRQFGTNLDELEQFMDRAEHLGRKRGALLIQLPPRLTNAHADHLERILDTLEDLDPDRVWPKAVEFRNLAWYTDEVYALLDRHKACAVLHDTPTGTWELNEGAAFVYLRFHGPGGDYRGSYEEQFLADRVSAIKGWLNKGMDVYAYFNNTLGTASCDAQRLKRMVANGD